MIELCNDRMFDFFRQPSESDQPVDTCLSVSAIRPGASVNMKPLQDFAVLFEAAEAMSSSSEMLV